MTEPRYPEAPGHRGIDTSIEAAEGVAPKAHTVRQQVYEMISDAGLHGQTTEELATRLGIDYGTVQPRTSELKKAGMIRDSGRRRKNAIGKNIIVWIIA